MFRGLDERFQVYIPILASRTPFPTFLKCRAFLDMEEARRARSAPLAQDTALHAAPAPTGGNNGSTSTSGNSRGRNRSKGKKQSDSSSSSSTRAPPTPAPLPAPNAHPWTGLVHAWPVPWRPTCLARASLVRARPCRRRSLVPLRISSSPLHRPTTLLHHRCQRRLPLPGTSRA